MNREEREEYVVQLYKENNSIREIARLVHMSFRHIGAIINKEKLEADRARGYTTIEEPKLPESKAFKMFSEGKSPIEVAIALDEPGDRVRAMYREYWELSGRYELAQLYDQAKYYIPSLLRLNKIVKGLGMEENDVIKVLELAKHNELERLQWKVEYLRNEIGMLEVQKTNCTNHILKLNRIIDEFQSSLPQNGGWYDNTDNLYHTYIEPDTGSYSIRLSCSEDDIHRNNPAVL
jgi:hypothetical protein